ncbi:MAG: GntR family transcriptional regulator [Lachnospiraceae bacterium]
MKDNQSLKEIVYQAIVNDILLYEYRPHEILNERALVEKYGYSKTPIREALLSLCNDNVLRSIPRYGYEVVKITTDDVLDMLQYRYLLEGGLLSIHYDRFSVTQINRLREIDRLCIEHQSDIWTHWTYNIEFHSTIVAFCYNNYAVKELEQCMNRLKIAYAQFTRNRFESSPEFLDNRNHEMILQSLEKKEPNQALFYLKNDLLDFGGENHVFDIRI